MKLFLFYRSKGSNCSNVLKYLEDEESVPVTPTAQAEIAVTSYLNMPKAPLQSNPLDYWKDNAKVFPILAEIAKSVLCVPGSSVSVERVFSKNGIIITQRRNRLSPTHVKQLSFIAHNYSYCK